MSNFVKKCPAISMFILAELIGVILIAPIIFGVVPADSMFFFLVAFSASLAGIILTAIVSGKAGLREMFRRLLIWRVGIGWWAFALFALGLMYLGGILLALVYHASQAWFAILVDPNNMISPYLGYAAIMTVTAIVVVLIYGPQNLSRNHERIMLKDA